MVGNRSSILHNGILQTLRASSRISGDGGKNVAIDADILPSGRSVQHQSQASPKDAESTNPIPHPDKLDTQHTSYAKGIQAQQAPRTPNHPFEPLFQRHKPQNLSADPPRHDDAAKCYTDSRCLSWIPSNLVFPNTRRCNIYQNDARDRVGCVGIRDSISSCEQKKKGKANRTSSLPLDGRLVLRTKDDAH